MQQITLYVAEVEIALLDVGATYTNFLLLRMEVRMFHPTSLQRSLFKLTESVPLAEFVADIYPDANLIPADPVQRAKMRAFITVVDSMFAPAHRDFMFNQTATAEAYLKTLEYLQSLLPEAGCVVGEWSSLADVAAASMLPRVELCLVYP